MLPLILPTYQAAWREYVDSGGAILSLSLATILEILQVRNAVMVFN